MYQGPVVKGFQPGRSTASLRSTTGLSLQRLLRKEGEINGTVSTGLAPVGRRLDG